MVYTSGRFFLSHALLFVPVFFSPFSIVITSLGEERAGLCATHAFVWLLRTRQCLSFFSLSLGIRGWLRLVTVALPGLFYHVFWPECSPQCLVV